MAAGRQATPCSPLIPPSHTLREQCGLNCRELSQSSAEPMLGHVFRTIQFETYHAHSQTHTQTRTHTHSHTCENFHSTGISQSSLLPTSVATNNYNTKGQQELSLIALTTFCHCASSVEVCPLSPPLSLRRVCCIGALCERRQLVNLANVCTPLDVRHAFAAHSLPSPTTRPLWRTCSVRLPSPTTTFQPRCL